MSGNILFYIVFLGQILLLSYYFPQKILGRMKSVHEKYPPSKYAKLYPMPVENYSIRKWGFKLFSRLILLLGFVILFLIMFVVDHANFADDGYISEVWPAAYGMIQFLPLILLEILEFKQFKLMRKANTVTTRKAELHRRRLFDFVSPIVVGMTVLLLIAAIIFNLSVNDFVIQWGHDSMQMAMVLTGSNLFLAAMGAWHLFGRKLDPHQSFADRAKLIKINLNSLLYVSMAMSVYFMTVAADDIFDLDFLGAALLSLYFQVIAFVSIGHVLRSLQVEDIDFEVYKEDISVT